MRRRERVDLLPEEVRRVEVDADRGPCRRAEPQHRRGVVDDEAGMRLDRDAHAVLTRELACLRPVRQHALVPLPVERVREVVRPRAGHPARPLRRLRLARAARERDDGRDARARGAAHRVAEVAVGLLRDVTVRVQRVRVTRQRRDLQPVRGGSRCDVLAAVRAGRRDLDRLAACIPRSPERIAERPVVEERQEEPELHGLTGLRSSIERAIASTASNVRRLSAALTSGARPPSTASRSSCSTPARSRAGSTGSGTRAGCLP